MIILSVCAFTKTGYELAYRLERELSWALVKVRKNTEDYKAFTKDAFSKNVPLVFIGATGIAVRTIALYVNDKLTDSPVIVIDEKGKFIIPILSGHVGAANEIAVDIAKVLGGEPVITTATDVENIFAVDVFARKNYLSIENRDGIKKVSSKLLKNETAYLYIEDGNIAGNKPENIELVSEKENADIVLIPKKYVLGIGCKKGKSFEELKDFVTEKLANNNIKIDEVCAIASIDLKAREEGLLTLSHFYHIPLITYSAGELEKVAGDFTESDFVKSVTGVSNVCERAALSFSDNGELIVKKTSFEGMTFAVAKYEGRKLEWNW